MKKHVLNRVRAGIGAGLAALALMLPGAATASVSAWGVTATANSPAISAPGQVRGAGTFNGIVNSTNVNAQVRVLQDGAQIGSIVTVPLPYQNPVQQTVYATASCSGGHTFVMQARLIRSGTGVATAWDSGPGKFLVC